MITKLLSITAFIGFSAMAHADQTSLCAAEIGAYVQSEFPSETMGGEEFRIASVLIVKSIYQDAFGDMDIEAYALFDEYGYIARRIFIGAIPQFDADFNIVGCSGFYTKASYPDPLAE